MNCLKCNYKNPGSIAYCQKCGARMDFTADEIAGSLVETAQNTEHYAKQSLTFAAILFLMAATAFVLSFGAPEEAYYMPALSKGAEHVKVEFKMSPDIPKLSVPIEIRKR